MQLAGSAIAGGNYENAAEVLREVIDRNPENMKARLMRANSLAASPRYLSEALEEVDQILEIDPNEVAAYEPRILAYLSMDDPEAASAALDELGERIEEGGGDEQMRGWYCATMAIFADDSDEEDLARERWEDCTDRFPAHSNVVRSSIAFYDKRGEIERSLEIAEAAFAQDPSSDSGYRMLVADRLRVLGRADEAEALLRAGIDEADPIGSAAAWIALSGHFEATGDFAASADALEQGLEIMQSAYGPQPDLAFSLAERLIRADEDERALALADEMTVASQRALVRARVAHKQGRLRDALAYYDEATLLWPDNAFALYHAARAARELGDFDRAEAWFRDSLRVSPKATDAAYQLALLLSAEGKWDAVRELLGQMKSSLPVQGRLLQIRALGRTLGAPNAWMIAHEFTVEHRDQLGAAIAAAVDGVGEGQGAGAAWRLVETVLDDELGPAQRVPVLESALRWVPEGGEGLEKLEAGVAQLIEAAPEMASVRALEAALLARRGDRSEAIRTYRLALELDPDNAEALRGLAVLIAESEPDEALELLDRLVVAKAVDRELFPRAIDALPPGAEVDSLLERALRSDPTNGPVALRIATRLEATGRDPERLAALARQAARFGGGEPAQELWTRVQTPDPHG
jgi:tetratricopeptide (TPR) repeat protein